MNNLNRALKNHLLLLLISNLKYSYIHGYLHYYRYVYSYLKLSVDYFLSSKEEKEEED